LNQLPKKEDVDLSMRNFELTNYQELTLQLGRCESSWFGYAPLISTNGGSDYNGGDNARFT